MAVNRPADYPSAENLCPSPKTKGARSFSAAPGISAKSSTSVQRILQIL